MRDLSDHCRDRWSAAIQRFYSYPTLVYIKPLRDAILPAVLPMGQRERLYIEKGNFVIRHLSRPCVRCARKSSTVSLSLLYIFSCVWGRLCNCPPHTRRPINCLLNIALTPSRAIGIAHSRARLLSIFIN